MAEDATSKKARKDKKSANAKLSATQERNLRKKRAKKREKETTKSDVVDSKTEDPSLKYIKCPTKAPTVRNAAIFFRRFCDIKDLPVHVDKTKGWRTEAKLAVRSSESGGPVIGLFAPGTHKVCPLKDCKAHHPAINKAVNEICEACSKTGAAIRGYDEESGTGDLRYLKLDVERATGRVQLTLVWHAASEEDAGKPLSNLVDELQKSELWYSIWVNFHPANKHVSRILAYEDSAWHRLAGKKKILREQLLTVAVPYEPKPRLCFPPNVFRQANLCAFENIVTAVRRFVPEGSRVVELYGGVGTIGLHLADLVKRLACSDENPHNQACFERSVSELPEELQEKLSYCTGDAVSQVETLKTADIVLVDPPRKGLDGPVLDALQTPAKRIKRLIYVSCGFNAFQKDCRRLKAAGWRVVHAEGFVLFPGADHLETLCVFDRPGNEERPEYAMTAQTAGKKKRKAAETDEGDAEQPKKDVGKKSKSSKLDRKRRAKERKRAKDEAEGKIPVAPKQSELSKADKLKLKNKKAKARKAEKKIKEAEAKGDVKADVTTAATNAADSDS